MGWLRGGITFGSGGGGNGPEPPEFVSDARPVDENPRRQQIDPEAARRVRFRQRGLAILLGAVFVSGLIAAVFGKGGLLELRHLGATNAGLSRSVDEASLRVAREEAAVDALDHQPMARERIARERLGLVRPGEVDFLLPRPHGSGAGAAAAAGATTRAAVVPRRPGG